MPLCEAVEVKMLNMPELCSICSESSTQGVEPARERDEAKLEGKSHLSPSTIRHGVTGFGVCLLTFGLVFVSLLCSDSSLLEW